ncbi:MAG: hypothetical protein AAGN46_08330 [Acidobacteriota bacterium]
MTELGFYLLLLLGVGIALRLPAGWPPWGFGALWLALGAAGGLQTATAPSTVSPLGAWAAVAFLAGFGVYGARALHLEGTERRAALRGASAAPTARPRAGRVPGTPSVLARAAPSVAAAAVLTAAALWPASANSEAPWLLAGLGWLDDRLTPWFIWGVLPTAAIALLLLLPSFDTRGPDEVGRRDEISLFLFLVAAVGALPMLFGIWELGDDAGATGRRLERTLSARLWEHLLDLELPAAWIVREAAGLLTLGALLLAPWILLRLRATRGLATRHRRRLGSTRFVLFVGLTTVLAAVPLRLFLLWSVGVEVWIDAPEIGFRW